MTTKTKAEKADTTTEPDPPKVIARARVKGNLYVVLLGIPAALALFWYSPTLLRWMDPKASSFPIDLIQAFVIAIVGIMMFAPVAHLLAKFNEKQFKENSFTPWSRYAVLYVFYYLGLVLVAASMLRPPL